MRSLHRDMVGVVFAGGACAAQDAVAKSKIVAAGLFKNGLSVIKREIDLPGAGTFRLEDLPEPVHGTWWIESDTEVETTSKMREVEAPNEGDIQFQRDLAGKKVTIHFKGGKPEPVSGVVVKMPQPKETEVVRDRYGRELDSTTAYSRFLVLKTAKGRMFIDSGNIGILEAEDADDAVEEVRKPVLLVNAPKAKKNDKLFVTYLTHGLAWAPSYRVDISDPKILRLELSAVIKNELSDLDQAELRLISGFPSVQFSDMCRSPLSPLQTWASFFQEITSGRAQRACPPFASTAGRQRDRSRLRPQYHAPSPWARASISTFKPSASARSAREKRCLCRLPRTKPSYERIVEWLISDNRDAMGRHLSP